jgi:hypothetical protein
VSRARGRRGRGGALPSPARNERHRKDKGKRKVPAERITWGVEKKWWNRPGVVGWAGGWPVDGARSGMECLFHTQGV